MKICKHVIVISYIGLSLTLYINQPQYIPVLTQEAGIRVLLHRQGQVPIMEEDGFDVNPGTKSGIAVRYVSNMDKKFCLVIQSFLLSEHVRTTLNLLLTWIKEIDIQFILNMNMIVLGIDNLCDIHVHVCSSWKI